VLQQIGPSSDARKSRRNKPLKSVIPKNRYEFLPTVCVALCSILFCKCVISVRKVFNCSFIFFMLEADMCTVSELHNK
jgi:hypothetical protein